MTTTSMPTRFTLCEGGRFDATITRLAGGAARRRLLLVVFGLAVGWVPVVILSAMDGTVTRGVALPFFMDFGPWVRYFVVVPVAVLAEPFADRLLGVVVGYFRSGMVPDTHRQAFEEKVAATQRLATNDVVELTIAAIALLLPHLEASGAALFLSGVTTWAIEPDGLSAAGRWYTWVSLPFAQFLMLRWAWRIVLWSRLLWHTSRMPLAITPAHPDRMGGLEVVTYAPVAFLPVFMALSALASAGSAQAIRLNQVQVSDLRGPVIAFVVLELAVLLVPQLFFARGAVRARLRGLPGFAAAGGSTAKAFERRWTEDPSSSQAEEMLESIDSSAMADYSVVYSNVQGMRPAGLNIRRLVSLALLLVAPFAPLLLYQYSVKYLLQQILGMFR